MLQLHRYFKESHSQYLPLDAPSWIFPSSLTAGARWGCGRWARSAWCWASPARSPPELLRARGWHQEPAGFGNPFLQGCLGLLAGRCCWQGTRGAAGGCGCAKEPGKGLPFLPGVSPCSKESQKCWEGAQTPPVRDPSPSKGRGHPPQPALGVVTLALSLSF